MPALEPIRGIRVVARPDALDGAAWTGPPVVVLRLAPDEALGIGATEVSVDDPDAIVEHESGFSVATVDVGGMARVAAHVDWSLDAPMGTLLQGKIAGVPAKVLVGKPSVLVVQTVYSDELRERLEW